MSAEQSQPRIELPDPQIPEPTWGASDIPVFFAPRRLVDHPTSIGTLRIMRPNHTTGELLQASNVFRVEDPKVAELGVRTITTDGGTHILMPQQVTLPDGRSVPLALYEVLGPVELEVEGQLLSIATERKVCGHCGNGVASAIVPNDSTSVLKCTGCGTENPATSTPHRETRTAYVLDDRPDEPDFRYTVDGKYQPNAHGFFSMFGPSRRDNDEILDGYPDLVVSAVLGYHVGTVVQIFEQPTEYNVGTHRVGIDALRSTPWRARYTGEVIADATEAATTDVVTPVSDGKPEIPQEPEVPTPLTEPLHRLQRGLARSVRDIGNGYAEISIHDRGLVNPGTLRLLGALTGDRQQYSALAIPMTLLKSSGWDLIGSAGLHDQEEDQRSLVELLRTEEMFSPDSVEYSTGDEEDDTFGEITFFDATKPDGDGNFSPWVTASKEAGVYLEHGLYAVVQTNQTDDQYLFTHR